MALKEYIIEEFGGINQSQDESRLYAGDTPDACNMDTQDGNLTVARGYVKHIPDEIPGTDEIRRLYVWRDLVTVRYVVIAGPNVYAYVTSDPAPAWKRLYTFSGIVGRRFDFQEAKIDSTDYLLIACGEAQIIKWDGESAAAVLFGSADRVSDVPANYLALHYSRLFCAGDPAHPSRLYWSCPPGTNGGQSVRTIEDWSRDDASPNTSGGHVEVGATDTDPITGLCALSNQLIIFKRDSIYRLLGDRPNSFRVVKVDAEVEEMANSSRITYGDAPFWMTRAGMFYFDGQTAKQPYNCRYIRNILASASLADCKGAENRDRLYWTCRIGEEDAVIVYDVKRRTYMLRNGFTVADLCARAGVLYMVNAERFVFRFEEGNSYNGKRIEASWQTPLTYGGARQAVKGLRELFLSTAGSGNDAVLIVEARAGRNVTNYRVMLPDNPYDVLEIPLKNEGRCFSLRFSNEAGGAFCVRGGVQLLLEQKERPR